MNRKGKEVKEGGRKGEREGGREGEQNRTINVHLTCTGYMQF